MQEQEPFPRVELSEEVVGEAREFVHQLMTLLRVEPGYDSACDVANRVCDQHGIGRVA